MTNVGIAFEFLEHDQSLPVGYSKATGHPIFDVTLTQLESMLKPLGSFDYFRPKSVALDHF